MSNNYASANVACLHPLTMLSFHSYNTKNRPMNRVYIHVCISQLLLILIQPSACQMRYLPLKTFSYGIYIPNEKNLIGSEKCTIEIKELPTGFLIPMEFKQKF